MFDELGNALAEFLFRLVFESIAQLPNRRSTPGCGLVVLLTLVLVAGLFAVVIISARAN